MTTSSPRRMRVASVLAVLLGIATIALALQSPPLSGMHGRYWRGMTWAGHPKLERLDHAVSLERWFRHFPASTGDFSISWKGHFLAPESGDYRFSLRSADGSTLAIDREIVAGHHNVHEARTVETTVALEGGFHAFEVRYFQLDGSAEIDLDWAPPGAQLGPFEDALIFVERPASEGAVRAYRIRSIALPLLLVGWCFIGAYLLVGAGSVRGPDGRPRRFRIHAKLAVLLVLSGVVMDALISLYSDKFPFELAKIFFTQPVHSNFDSWTPIWRGLEYFRQPEASFTDLVINHWVKFQYPLTSLLLFRPIEIVARTHDIFVHLLNLLSWLWVVASVPFLASILNTSLSRFADVPEPTRANRGSSLVLAAGFTVLYYPILVAFMLGQVQNWLYAWFVIALWAWLKGRKGLSGGMIGLISMVKPQLGLLLVWALLRKQWSFAAGITAVAAAFGLTAIGVYGWKNQLEYLEVLAFISSHAESYYLNHSFAGLAHRLIGESPWNLHTPHGGFPAFHPVVNLVGKVSSVVLIASALFFRRREHERAPELDLSIATLSFTMASPVAWAHHYSFALPIFVIAGAWALGARARGALIMLGLAFLLTANDYAFTQFLAASKWNVLQSYVLFGGLILLGTLYSLRHRSKPV